MSGALATHSRRAEPSASRPSLYGDRARWGLLHGHAMRVLCLLPAASIDAIVSDPPYGLNFNNQAWDGGALADGLGFQAFTRAWAEQACRLLKPGGYLACFGASRTMHRAVGGVEDAGLEVRDQLLWLYGSGVPKGRRLPGGVSSTLKPAYEPILLARKPLDPKTPTLAANLAEYGTGALNIDAARLIEQRYRDTATGELVGRWPANVVLGHDVNCGSVCNADCVATQIDRTNPVERRRGSSTPPRPQPPKERLAWRRCRRRLRRSFRAAIGHPAPTCIRPSSRST